MRPRTLAVALLVLLVAGVCLRLGAWQLGRWHEKRAANAAMAAGLAAPPVPFGDARPPDSLVAGRRVALRGRWDRGRELLVAAGLRREVPVSQLVLPLLLADGSAVLVNRGMLPAEEAAVSDLSGFADSGLVVVQGWAEPMRRGAGPPGPRALASSAGTGARLSARWLDADSLAARYPYALAGVVVRELPGPGTPAGLEREAPPPLAEGVHLGYAVQWFAIAAVVLGGGVALVVRDRRHT